MNQHSYRSIHLLVISMFHWYIFFNNLTKERSNISHTDNTKNWTPTNETFKNVSWCNLCFVQKSYRWILVDFWKFSVNILFLQKSSHYNSNLSLSNRKKIDKPLILLEDIQQKTLIKTPSIYWLRTRKNYNVQNS